MAGAAPHGVWTGTCAGPLEVPGGKPQPGPPARHGMARHCLGFASECWHHARAVPGFSPGDPRVTSHRGTAHGHAAVVVSSGRGFGPSVAHGRACDAGAVLGARPRMPPPAALLRCFHAGFFALSGIIQQQTSGRVWHATEIPPRRRVESRGPKRWGKAAWLQVGAGPTDPVKGGGLSPLPPAPSPPPHDQVLPQIPLHGDRVFEAFVS